MHLYKGLSRILNLENAGLKVLFGPLEPACKACESAWACLNGALCAGIAQLVERVICNHDVAGSTPAAGTTFQSEIIQ